jgi:hypothetical protein
VGAELAVHFDRGREYGRAVVYLQQAAENARLRHGCQQAIDHLSRGLFVLARLPGSREHAQQELDSRIALRQALTVPRGQERNGEDVYARTEKL